MKHVKYPRTYHLPNSPGKTSDDKTLKNVDHFKGQQVVVTLKMDGENTTMYSDHIHARSLDSRNHPSRNWVKALHGNIKKDIPENMRICGENVYAKHSIFYKTLESYFYCFSIWEDDLCLDWNSTKTYAEMLNLPLVPVIYQGIFDEDIHQYFLPFADEHEGYVVRLEQSFHYNDFNKSVGKYVRSNHVHTDQHWMHSELIVNSLSIDATFL